MTFHLNMFILFKFLEKSCSLGLYILTIVGKGLSRFGFEDVIAPVPSHCIRVTFKDILF